jgi:hypothetical protein
MAGRLQHPVRLYLWYFHVHGPRILSVRNLDCPNDALAVPHHGDHQ